MRRSVRTESTTSITMKKKNSEMPTQADRENRINDWKIGCMTDLWFACVSRIGLLPNGSIESGSAVRL